MKRKINCWEYKACGREPGGERVRELGICPAAAEARVSGMHGGVKGGRVCWALSGTLCHNAVQGSFASKVGGCLQCDFYNLVSKEEGRDFILPQAIFHRLRQP